MTTWALDILGKRGFSAQVNNQGIASSQMLTEVPPTCLLPIRSSENLIAGTRADQHRRGRGYSWPPEAQTPVLDDPTNGIGRIPLAAALHQLVQAESGPEGWGRLSDTGMSWRPDGLKQVTIDAQRLIAATVHAWTSNHQHVGLVVPDGLQVAGQQSILDACAEKNIAPFLVPCAMASALAWCRSPLQEHHLSAATPGEGTCIGHLIVVDVGLGAWAISKVPIQAVLFENKPWLIPIRDHQLVKTDISLSGWTLAAMALQCAQGERWLNSLTNGNELFHFLSGTSHIGIDTIRNHRVASSRVSALSSLEVGTHLDHAFTEIRDASVSLFATNHGHCLGSIVTGACVDMCLDDLRLGDIVAKKVNATRFEVEEQAPVIGAAWASAGRQYNWPTWREVMIPISLYYIGKDNRGDDVAAWKELITASTVDAGAEYRNPEPITGLALRQGSEVLRLTLRRMKPDGGYLYRDIETTKVKATDQDTPVVADVRAVAGQGFAIVSVCSKIEGIFSSTLNWNRMRKADGEPEKPKLSYVPGTVNIVSEKEMWSLAQEHIETLNEKFCSGTNDDIRESARAATKICNRCIQADYYDRRRKRDGPNDSYIFYASVGLDGNTSSVADEHPLEVAKDHVEKWILNHSKRKTDTTPVRRLAGWWYRGCPESVISITRERVQNKDPLKAIDLHIVGRCFVTLNDIALFMSIAPKFLSETDKPLNWLRALRNITRLNESALSTSAIPNKQAKDLAKALIHHLTQALDNEQKNIASECFETLVYVLKRRRYQPDYLGNCDPNRIEIESLATSALDLKFLSRRGTQLCEILLKFLRNEATQDDIDTIVIDQSEEAESDDE